MAERVARAVVITRPGGPEVLDVADRAVRDPGPGEVRLAVHAAAVNPTDVLLRTNGAAEPSPPWIPGMDAAGTVESVGADVEHLAVGDQVMAGVNPGKPEGGAQAELRVVPAASVVAIPDGATFEQAATLPMNGLTAMLALDLLELSEGDILAVTGGAGVVASYAIPLAKTRGLFVLADAAPADEALVRSFGADVVLPRGEDFAGEVRAVVPDGVAGLIDTARIGGSVLSAIRDGGAISVLRGWEWDDVEVERGIRVRPVAVRTVLEETYRLDELRRLASNGTLQLRVAGTYPPEAAAEAQRVTVGGGIRGRAVIVFSPDDPEGRMT